MKKVRSFFSNLWRGVVFLLERANLMPLLVIVSAWHYTGALMTKDPLPVAVSLGVLIDLGHYRMVKSYLAKEDRKRLTVLILWTGLTVVFHDMWYHNLLLAASVPLLIILLALLSRWERWSAQGAVLRSEPASTPAPLSTPASTPALPSSEASAQASTLPALVCPECGAAANKKGIPFTTKKHLAGHQRSHALHNH